MKALAASPHLAGLRSLSITWEKIEPAGWKALAESDALRSLESLALDHTLTRGSASVAHALVGATFADNLRELSVADNPIPPEGIELLRAHFGPRLRLG